MSKVLLAGWKMVAGIKVLLTGWRMVAGIKEKVGRRLTTVMRGLSKHSLHSQVW